METLELKIGLNKAYKTDVTNKLNVLLSDFQVYYMNLRGLHWNIKGRKFFLLHEKFEELYNDANDVVDEIAERILTLGTTPYHSFQEYLENQTIKSIKDVTDGDTAVRLIMENLNSLLNTEREVLAIAGDNDDEGTASLMSDLIGNQEKLIWMLTAYLN